MLRRIISNRAIMGTQAQIQALLALSLNKQHFHTMNNIISSNIQIVHLLVYSYNQQRWSDLAKFACLRASLNKDSEKSFQELAKKNNVSTQELVELSKIVTMNLDVLQRNIHSDAFAEEKENTLRRYRESSVGTRGNLQNLHSTVSAKYPNLGSNLGQVAGYKEAYQAINDIFVVPSMSVSNLIVGSYGQNYVSEFKSRSEQYVNSLLKENEKNPEAVKTIQQIRESLNDIIRNFEENPASVYSHVLTLLHSRGVQSKSDETQAVSLQTVGSVPSVNANLSVPVVGPSTQEFDAEAAFIQEANAQLQQNVGNLPWDGQKKKIFQGQAQCVTELPYYLIALLSGLGMAYFLYAGDAKYKTLVLTPVVGIAAFVLFKRNQIINRIPTLTELFLHKDGKHVDAVVSFNGQLISKNGVPISTIKLHRGDHNVTLDLDFIEKPNIRQFLTEQSGQEGKITYNFSQVRYLGGKNGQILNLGDAEVLVPFNNQGNRLVLNQIFKGVEVLPAS